MHFTFLFILAFALTLAVRNNAHSNSTINETPTCPQHEDFKGKTVDAGNSVFPNFGTHGMLGFARKGGTTGGLNGPIVYIDTLEALSVHMRNTRPCVLVLTRNIIATRKVEIIMGANKSLIGSWRAHLINNVYFLTSPRSSNIIFQNLLFKHNKDNIGNGDTQIIISYGKRYWIDHCTFDGEVVNSKDLGKLLKIMGIVDYVTISNSIFMNHEYGLIFGYPVSSPELADRFNNFPRVTMMFNRFTNLNVRGPGLMRYGMFHVYNNYVNNCHLGFTVSYNAKIYSERNFFHEARKYDEILDDKGSGYFKDILSVGNVRQKQLSHLTNWNPYADYKYKLYPADFARQFCVRFSGAQSAHIVFGGIP